MAIKKKKSLSLKYMNINLYTAEGLSFTFLAPCQADAFNKIHEDIITARHFFHKNSGESWPMPIWTRSMEGGVIMWGLNFCVDVKVHKSQWRKIVGDFLSVAHKEFSH